MTFKEYVKQNDWKYKDICKYHSAENVPRFNVIQGVPRNMTVSRRFTGRLWSLKWFTAFIRKPNIISSILGLIVTKHR